MGTVLSRFNHWFAAASALLCFISAAPAIARDLCWEPQKTWVFAVGVLEFQDKNLASWNSKNRRDSQFVDFFHSRGVPASHISYIKDKNATLANLKQSFRSLLAKTAPGDFLIFYYTGHGSKDDDGTGYFANYDASDETWWEVNWIVDTITKEFKGSKALMFADCCTSDCLAKAARRQKGRVSFAVMTSATGYQNGQGNWVFSQSILDGLRGEPFVDTNDGKRISIANLAAYAKRECNTFEGETVAFLTTGALAPSETIAFLNGKPKPAPKPVQVLYEGKWWKGKLVETHGDQAKIHWIQLGYDSSEDEEWVPISTVRALKQ